MRKAIITLCIIYDENLNTPADWGWKILIHNWWRREASYVNEPDINSLVPSVEVYAVHDELSDDPSTLNKHVFMGLKREK